MEGKDTTWKFEKELFYKIIFENGPRSIWSVKKAGLWDNLEDGIIVQNYLKKWSYISGRSRRLDGAVG